MKTFAQRKASVLNGEHEALRYIISVDVMQGLHPDVR